MMDFYAVLDQVLALLRQRGRVSYRAFKRQFGLDDAYLNDLKMEINLRERVAESEQLRGQIENTSNPTPKQTSILKQICNIDTAVGQKLG